METDDALVSGEEIRVLNIMLSRNAVFVFGSNLAGRHGKGAALVAKALYGAVDRVGVGVRGRCYALPTKDTQLKPLVLKVIAQNVQRFLAYARSRDDLIFAVTRVGCGHAGYTDEQIAPMFENAPANCFLPPVWRKYLNDAYDDLVSTDGPDGPNPIP